MSRPLAYLLRGAQLGLVVLLAGQPTSALAAPAQCRGPSVFVGVDAIGVDGVTALSDASLRSAEPDGGVVPIRIEVSDEPACIDNRTRGFRVSPLSPLEAGARYVLSGVAVQPNCSSPVLGAFTQPFVAPARVALPADLPAPQPELLVQRCAGRPDYYYIDLPRPNLPAAPVEVRLAFADTLHYCRAHGWLGIHCAPGQRYPYPLRWWAGVPHTGLNVLGPRVEWEVVCDAAREVPCNSPGLAVFDAGTVARDAGGFAFDAGVMPAGLRSDAALAQPDAGSQSMAGDPSIADQDADAEGCRLARGGAELPNTALLWLGLWVLRRPRKRA